MSIHHLVQLSLPRPPVPFTHLTFPWPRGVATGWRRPPAPYMPSWQLFRVHSSDLDLQLHITYLDPWSLYILHLLNTQSSLPAWTISLSALLQSLQVSKSTLLPSLSGLLSQKVFIPVRWLQFTYSDLASCPCPRFLRTSQNLMVASFSKWCCFPLSKVHYLWLVPFCLLGSLRTHRLNLLSHLAYFPGPLISSLAPAPLLRRASLNETRTHTCCFLPLSLTRVYKYLVAHYIDKYHVIPCTSLKDYSYQVPSLSDLKSRFQQVSRVPLFSGWTGQAEVS